MAKYRITWNGSEPKLNSTEIEADRYKAEKDWVEFFKGPGSSTRLVASARSDQVLVIERVQEPSA